VRRALAVLLVVASAGCAAGHNALGPRAEPCFRTLPVATTATRAHGRLVGVRSVSDETATRIMGRPIDASGVCLIAFRGTFKATDVDHLVPGSPPSGKYAVVAVSMRSRQPLGTKLIDQLPLRFQHTR
jgi:hypothetical protein